MNREELEKMFDEAFGDLGKKDMYNKEGVAMGYIYDNEDLKQFIFDTIIPEVLKSVLVEKLGGHTDELQRAYRSGNDNCVDKIKQKAKELYNINL